MKLVLLVGGALQTKEKTAFKAESGVLSASNAASSLKEIGG